MPMGIMREQFIQLIHGGKQVFLADVLAQDGIAYDGGK
jgi:hypothetical protein